MNRQPDYMIYPSLLDAYTAYKTADYMTEEELLARINRAGTPSAAALRGTAFNNIVDRLSAGAPVGIVVDGATGEEVYTVTDTTGTYTFPVDICDRMAALYSEAMPQQFVEGDLMTRHGLVRLYGIVDGLFPRSVRDIKTTERYKAQKYRHSWQKLVYPYCVRQMGGTVDEFVFDATDFKSVYTEVYTGPQIDIAEHVGELEDFIEYIEGKRAVITSRKLFGIINQ